MTASLNAPVTVSTSSTNQSVKSLTALASVGPMFADSGNSPADVLRER